MRVDDRVDLLLHDDLVIDRRRHGIHILGDHQEVGAERVWWGLGDEPVELVLGLIRQAW